MSRSLNEAAYRDFLRSLDAIPWFSQVGKPVSVANVTVLSSWEEWTGPEDDSVWPPECPTDDCMRELRRHYDRKSLDEALDTIRKRVIAVASNCVPYDPHEDAYHAPNVAVWQAAEVAALVGTHLLCGEDLPGEEIEAQWEWFKQGRWPAGLTDPFDDHPHAWLIY